MIKSVTVTNPLGESIKLELAFPEKSGFAVRALEGLGPAKANINSTELATIDGSVFTSSKVMSRNIVIKLAFIEKPTIEDSRLLSYKYFPIKKQVTLLVETDKRESEISGYVEANEPDMFSKEEGSQISIICPNPYFHSRNDNVTIFSGVEPEFEFEFSNESLSDDLVEFGNIVNVTEKTVYYTGDADAGIYIKIHALGSATNLAIYNNDTREAMRIDSAKLVTLTGKGIGAGDDIFISTSKGVKGIMLLREGIYTNILNCLDKNADWFHLERGDNLFSYTADTGVTNLQFSIDNQILYEGV